MVLIDESGFQLQPLVRRTWAPQDQTPVLANWDRHDRITVLTAMVWTPNTDRVQMYFELQPHNATAIDFIGFLSGLHQEWQRELVVVWDRLGGEFRKAKDDAFSQVLA